MFLIPFQGLLSALPLVAGFLYWVHLFFARFIYLDSLRTQVYEVVNYVRYSRLLIDDAIRSAKTNPYLTACLVGIPSSQALDFYVTGSRVPARRLLHNGKSKA